MAEVRLPEDKLSASFLFMFAARCPGPGVTTTAATLAITNSLSHVSSPFPFISVKVVVEFRWDNFSGGIMGRQQAAGSWRWSRFKYSHLPIAGRGAGLGKVLTLLTLHIIVTWPLPPHRCDCDW